jgi:hypothetical protein
VKFQLEVEDWDGKTEAYAATTVVFAENKPEGVTDELTGTVHAPNSNFIYGKELPELTGVPALPSYIFLGYYDAPETGAKRYYDGTLVRQKYVDTDNDGDIDESDIAVWDKAGPAHTLYAQWQECFWAGSNIYFGTAGTEDTDGVTEGFLTFALSGENKDGYQGLYFKWGSLIGVAAGANGDYGNDTYLYIPDLTTGKYYKIKSGGIASYSGTIQAIIDYKTARANGTWSNILIASDGDLGIGNVYYGRDQSPLTDKSEKTLYAKYLGDICKYLSDKKTTNDSGLTKEWVMPKSIDFGSNSQYTNVDPSWTGMATFDGTDENGTGATANGLKKYTTSEGEVIQFPASGFRDDTGLLQWVGVGYYWSSSCSWISSQYRLWFDYSSPDADDDFYPTAGHSVRCVRK